MPQLEKVLYTARAHTTGGREGESRTDDGQLAVKLARPGVAGTGTNPEQLFAVGWSACFISAIGIVAQKMKVSLPPNLAVDIEIDLGLVEGNYGLAARFNVTMPGIETSIAHQLLKATEEICPYSRATRGNVDAVFNLV